ncbi:MAG TPA: ribonuclease P protein component [Tepidisphaeraceae bacterium]
MTFSFPKSHILRGKKRFAEVFQTGRRQSRGPLLLISLPNNLSHHRIGIVTPKKVGNAVRRNRVRRQIREAFRHMQAQFQPPHDFMLIVRPHEPAPLSFYQRLLSDLLSAATGSKISP